MLVGVVVGVVIGVVIGNVVCVLMPDELCMDVDAVGILSFSLSLLLFMLLLSISSSNDGIASFSRISK